MSEQRDEHIKALIGQIDQHTAQRRRESDRAAALQRGRLLIAEREKSLPADVPLHKRGFGVLEEEGP
jgi:hypothetical protein